MTEALAKKQATSIAASIEQVLIGGDLSKLSAEQRLSYYKAVCDSVGLNPLTKPFDYISLSGKLVLYAKRDATDQLRKIHGVSILGLDSKMVQDVYVVTAQAEDKDKRVDTSTGAVNLAKLSGDALANALMKAETKAKRRVTLSICGLGLLDETEIETIPDARPVPETTSRTSRSPIPSDNLDVVCSECRGTNSHAKNCSFHPANKQQGTPPTSQDAPTGTPVYELTVDKVESLKTAVKTNAKGEKTGGRPYGKLYCRDANGTEMVVCVFHDTPQKYMGLWSGKVCEMEITARTAATGGTLFSLDKIHRAGDVRYEDNQPVADEQPDGLPMEFQ